LAALVSRSFHWVPNPDGTEDGHFPLGDKNPHVDALAWDNAGLIAFVGGALAQRTTGTGAVSLNVRQFLSGTNALTATFTLLTVLGPDAVSVSGFGLAGDNLTNPITSAHGGSFKIGADDGTGIAYSEAITYSIVAPITDTLAPCIPTGGAALAGVGAVTFSCDIPGDAHDGVSAGKLATVQLRIGGVTVEEKAVQAGLSPGWTLLNFGSSTPSPAFLQSGNSWALSGGGLGIDGTTESFPFNYAQVTGDFLLHCRVTSFTSIAQQFAKCGLMIRENIAGLDRFWAFYVQKFDSDLQVKARVTQGGSAANQSTSAAGLSLPVDLFIQRSGATLTAWSSNGGTPTQFLSQTFALGSTCYAGTFLTSRIAGTAVDATLDQLWVSNQGRVTFTPTFSSAAKTATFRAKDFANNLSADSVSVTGTPLAPTIYRKWHPGHGIRNGDKAISPTNLGYLNTYPQFLYSDSVWLWGQVEPTRGNRDWSGMEADLAAAKTRGKKIIFQLTYKKFNTTNASNIMPADMMSGGYVTAGGGLTARVWQQSIMDPFIATYVAMIQHFDNDPDVEMFYTPESSSSLTVPLPSDFSRSGYANQLKRLYAAAGPAALHTIVAAQINFTTGEVAGLIEAAYQAGCGMADPDAIDTTANSLFKGVSSGSETAIRDYRGKMPRMSMASSPTLGGKDDNGPPSNVLNWMRTNGTTHGLWVTFQPTPNSVSNIISALTANGSLAPWTACPVIYNGTCQA
jgi:hypothetical protein